MKRLRSLMLSILMIMTIVSCSKEQDKDIVKKDNSKTTKIAEKKYEENKEKHKSSPFDKNDIKEGDKILGLRVKSIDLRDGSLDDITFSGKIYLSGIYEYTEESGDGGAYVFKVDEKYIKKLPTTKGFGEIDSFIISNTEAAELQFQDDYGAAHIIIEDYSIGERQIIASAKLVKVNSKRQLAKLVFSTYVNSKYGFKISYSPIWRLSEESDAGDGVILYNENGCDIRVYGGYNLGYEIEEINQATASGKKVSGLKNKAGQYGSLIESKKDGKVLFHYILLNDEKQCQLYTLVTEKFYKENSSYLKEMASTLELQ